MHQLPVRIYYEDTDSGGIVYYANYLKYAERGRTELLRDLGIESQQMMATLGIGLTVRRCNIEYFRSAKLDDEVVVETDLLKVGGASLDLRQAIRRGTDRLVEMEIKLACVNFADGRPTALTKQLRTSLQQRMNAIQNSNE